MARVRGIRDDSEQHDRQSDAARQRAARAEAARAEAAQARANELTALPTGGRATQVGGHAIAAQATQPIAVARRSRGFTSVLGNRYFLRLWMAQLISQTALNA